ncbi:Uncharacterised protein [Achromobacter denitrificans]|nr:Uncharacterised protein [Achromobacter denitrificans]
MVVVHHALAQGKGLALDLWLVVAFHFPHMRHVQVVVIQEARLLARQERQLVDAVAVFQLLAAEHVIERHEGATRARREARQHLADFLGQGGGHFLVGVHVQHDGMREGQLLQAPLLLLRVLAVPLEVGDAGAQRRRHRAGGVGAVGIHHEDFVKIHQRLQAFGDVALFVLRHDHHGNRYFLHDSFLFKACRVASAAGIAR